MSEVEQIDLAAVQDSDFRPHVDTEFVIRGDGGEIADIPLTLIEVSEYPDHRADDERHNQKRKPFGLVFKCDVGVLAQGTYRFEHAKLPPLELFVSPFDGGENWCKVESIIN